MSAAHFKELPEPERPRWQPLRSGLVELYHYDVEEFRFRDGHLLLRGNNGTGKSKVLSLTLPFLLDAHLSAARVEPDGDRHKRMEWNLLMGGRYERRIGYTWIEFGRRDEGGEPRFVTLGCGLRAVAGRSAVDAWFFVTEQRVARDLWLVTDEHTAISKERLAEAIGTHGQVFKTAQDYRRAVDERLFGLGAERYGALVDTLIQLRQPQLSKQPNEQRLSDALTEALAPLDKSAIESVAEAMGQLEDLRRELDELDEMRRAVASFSRRYRRYAQIATRRKARVLRQAQTEFDNASREYNAAKETLERARDKVERWRAEQLRLDEALAAGRKRLEVLQADPVMRDARRIADARERAEEWRATVREAERRVTAAREQAELEQHGTATRRHDAQHARGELVRTAREAAEQAAAVGVAGGHAERIADVTLPDGVAAAPAEFAAGWLQSLRELAARRREQIEVVRARLRELAAADAKRAAARSARDQCADAFDAATESLRESAARLDAAAATLLDAWHAHAAALEVLELDRPDEALAALELWLETLDGANPLRAALDAARTELERTLATREAALDAQRRELSAERGALREEQTRLAGGEDRRPPAPYTRGTDVRVGRPGAPLWQLVDFAPDVADAERAGIEAALEVAGLLDAWLIPDGVLLDPLTHDVVLVARAAHAPSLAERLVVTMPATAAGLDADVVSGVLRSIACAAEEPERAECWISPRGEFRVGVAHGAWSKPRAEYIGHAAREAARRARLAQIAARLAELESARAECDVERERCAQVRRTARDEHAAAPSDEALFRAAAERAAAERERRGAQVRLGEAETRLAAAEQDSSAARAALTNDARDLMLPSDADGVERVGRALEGYRTAVADLVNAARNHRRALAELAEQDRRETRARSDAEGAVAERAAKVIALREVEAVAESLQATVGKQVEELLSAIDAAKAALGDDQKASNHARAQLNVTSQHRGMAETDCSAKEQRLNERVEARRVAVAGLEAFATLTELPGVALADVADLETPAASPWGIDAALTLARRAEAALADVPAEESDWSRVQSDLGRDLTELQNAMSAHGHSATAEPTDHGLVVRIVHQQRPVRPDVLERRLDAELAERKLVLSARERAVLEEHLEKEVAASLQRMIQDAERRVAAINYELARRPTSTGVRYRLVWQPLPEDAEDGVPGLAEARKRLLKTSVDAWSVDDRLQVGNFLHRRIAAVAARDEDATLFESLSRALDYRCWHRFSVQRYQDGQWRPLSGPASSGERALGLTVPLFAAASAHYESADPRAPRLVLLDEAFAGIDDEARASCMALIREFDLDFVMTSEREWGCYAELPGLAICQLVRREGMDAVFVSRWTWDGRVRRPIEDTVRRFPDEEAIAPPTMLDASSAAEPP
jgi:uncharacterized protein (TIGR02680 family)